MLRQEVLHTPPIYYVAEMLGRLQCAVQPFRQRASQPGSVRGGKAEFALAYAYFRRQNIGKSLPQDIFSLVERFVNSLQAIAAYAHVENML